MNKNPSALTQWKQTQEEQGFLIGRQSRDVDGHIEIAYWVKTDSGTVKVIPERQQSVFFVVNDAIALIDSLPRVTILQSGYTSFSHDALLLVSCESLAIQRNLQQLLDNQGLAYYEHDIRPEDRFLMERGIRGGVRFQGQMDKTGQVFSQARLKPTDYQPKWIIWSLDIETSVSRNEILSIAIVSGELEACFIVSANTFTDDSIHPFPDEKSLLLGFMRFVRLHNPTVFIGWSVIAFDLNFIDQRCQALGLKPNFGVGGNRWRFKDKDPNVRRLIDIPGRVALDGITLLKVGGYQFDSYSLDSVSQELLDDGKLLHGSQRWQEIERLHKEAPSELVKYNIQDCRLVWRIFQKLNLLELQQTRVELTGIPLSQTGGSIAAFENLYLPLLHQYKRAAPNHDNDEFVSSPGGFVMSSQPGLYQNVLVFDFKSLYPSIIRTFLVDPLARIEKSDAEVEGFLGANFASDYAILPNLISHLAKAREQAKKQNNAILSYAIKIIMNSFYGVLGSNLCRFYHPELASSITMRGHQVLSITKNWFEELGATVIYGDTDSLFVTLSPELTYDEVQKQGKALCLSMNQKWQQWCMQEYDIACYLELEFEQTYERFFMPTIRGQVEGSKKRYAGQAKGELVFKGLEAVRSDWTPFARTFQKRLFEHVFNDLSPVDYILQVLTDLYAGTYDEALIYQKRLSRPLNHYVKVTPPHVKAARLADSRRTELGIKPEYAQGRCTISYYYSRSGVQPFEADDPIINPDYDHYVEKQIEPIADSVLLLFGTSMADLTSKQMGLL
ncbi:DNA polymerase II [Marinomonas agarivorans]|nr:DNA polymerase II [Marinomonas agarivorans]